VSQRDVVRAVGVDDVNLTVVRRPSEVRARDHVRDARAVRRKCAALIDGTITGKEGDSFKAGTLGTFKVGADGAVLLGDPFQYNAGNIDQFNF